MADNDYTPHAPPELPNEFRPDILRLALIANFCFWAIALWALGFFDYARTVYTDMMASEQSVGTRRLEVIAILLTVLAMWLLNTRWRSQKYHSNM